MFVDMILHNLQSLLGLFNDMVHVYVPCWRITDVGNEGLYCNATFKTRERQHFCHIKN